MTLKLGDVATVRSGLVLSRKQAKVFSDIVYKSINLKSINAEGYIDKEHLDVYNASEILEPKYITHKGDILIRLTSPYTAVLIEDDTTDLVVSSNFVIVRTNIEKILPEYLYWLLNTKEMRRRIFESSTSNMLSAVNAKFFTDLKLDTVPIDKQMKIAEMSRLARREIFLLNKLAEKKEILYSERIKEFQKKQRSN